MTGHRGRLVRHDALLLRNAAAATFARWSDRGILALVLIGGLFAGRSLAAPWEPLTAALAASALGSLIGPAAGWRVDQRLRFHESEGALAADALRRGERSRLGLAIHASLLAALGAAVALMRPDALLSFAGSYVVGALLGHAAWRLVGGRGEGRLLARLRGLPRLLHRPAAGLFAALGVSAVAALAGEGAGALALVGALSFIAALLLTPVDAAAVRFAALSGHGPMRAIVAHVRSLASFAAVATLAVFWLASPPAAALVAGASALALLRLSARVLAYRIHAKRTADMMLSIAAAALLLAAFTAPPLAPLLLIVAGWRLYRRSADATWWLA